MYSIVLFLNNVPKGGGTRFYKDEQKSQLVEDELRRFVGKPELVEFTVEPKVGRAVVFFHNIMHEGVPIDEGKKYIIRSDVMYKRNPPVLVEEKDKEAFKIYSEAVELCENATKPEEFKEATKLFKKVTRMSQKVSDIYKL